MSNVTLLSGVRHSATSDKASTQADPFYRGRLNLHAQDLQADVARRVDEFNEIVTFRVRGQRVDVRANGMLSDILAATPVIIYDLPELKMHCETAFVDTTGRMYICDTFYRMLVAEQDAGQDSLNFLLRHECEHLRRLHLQRMMDFDPEDSNDGCDMRINHDIITMAVSMQMQSSNPGVVVDPSSKSFLNEVKSYIDNIGPAISTGIGLNMAEFIKYQGWSEERITADIASRPKQPAPAAQNRDVSFGQLMEGAAQDCDAIATMPSAPANTMPNWFGASVGGGIANVPVSTQVAHLAKELRALAASNGKASLQSMRDCLSALLATMDTMEMTGRDIQHQSGVLPVNTQDAYVNGLKPRERLMLAAKVLNMILNPSNRAGQKGKSGMSIKDLDSMIGRGEKPDGQPSQGQSNDSEPAANVDSGHDHVMSAEKLAEILKRNGLNDASKVLGYDDLEKLPEQKEAAKQAVVSAINTASENLCKIGAASMPGGHLVNYAVAKLNEFYEPVLSLKMAVKEVIEGVGRSSRYEYEEPWQNFYVDPTDIGVQSSADIPYSGSYVPGTTEKSVVLILGDTSGSVSDSMLKRFGSEMIGFARESNGETAPEVIILFADTLCRGQPIFIDERNIEEVFKSGLGYGGRGGTSFQASLEHAFEMFRPGGGGPLEGRKLDGLIYFTDSFDYVPDQAKLEEKAFECGFSRLPTSVFLVPMSCYNEPFAEGVKGWAATVFFNPKRELGAKGSVNDIDMEEIEASIAARGTRAIKP